MDGRKCHDCDYRKEEYRDGGWCYMFKTQPTFTKCSQKIIKGKRVRTKIKTSIWDLLF